jgi:hypothetical protein
MFSRLKYIIVIARYHHWINHANIRNQLHVLKDCIKKKNHDNDQNYFSSSSTIDNDNIPIDMKVGGINDDVNDNKNGHCDIFDSHQSNDKDDHNNDDDDDDDYTRQYIDIIPTESHSLTIDDMISYNFHTIINDEKNINNYDNNTIADITNSNYNSTNNNSIQNNNNDKKNIVINNDNNYSTIDLNSIEDTIGVFRESEIDDIRVLVNNYTAPALAEALRDRETTLQSAAMLFFNNDMISLKHLLSPFCKV